jgi:hypothetical protein
MLYRTTFTKLIKNAASLCSLNPLSPPPLVAVLQFGNYPHPIPGPTEILTSPTARDEGTPSRPLQGKTPRMCAVTSARALVPLLQDITSCYTRHHTFSPNISTGKIPAPYLSSPSLSIRSPRTCASQRTSLRHLLPCKQRTYFQFPVAQISCICVVWSLLLRQSPQAWN